MIEISFIAPLWLWQGKGAWHFVTLPVEESDRIRFFNAEKFTGVKKPKGWGSIKVKARIGKTAWDTSIFPDTKSGSYLLPVKADVRKAEKLAVLGQITVKLQFQSL